MPSSRSRSGRNDSADTGRYSGASWSWGFALAAAAAGSTGLETGGVTAPVRPHWSLGDESSAPGSPAPEEAAGAPAGPLLAGAPPGAEVPAPPGATFASPLFPEMLTNPSLMDMNEPPDSFGFVSQPAGTSGALSPGAEAARPT